MPQIIKHAHANSISTTVVPVSDVSVAWAPVGTATVACAGGTSCGEVDEGTTPNTTNYVQTGTGGRSSVTDTYGLTAATNVSSASSLTLYVYAEASTNANGGAADNLNINLIVNGTAQTASVVTPVYGTWGWFSVTFTGSWTSTQTSNLQVSISNTINGSGSPSKQEDNIEVADIYGSLTYQVNVTANQNSYRVFNNQDATTQPSFVRAWGEANAGVTVYDGIHTSDGGYAVTGNFISNSVGNVMFLAKFNPNGSTAWSTTWGGDAQSYGESVIQTSSGGYAVTGFTNGFPAGASYTMFLATFTSTGSLSWDITWGGGGWEAYGTSVIQTSSGGYAVAGSTYAFGPGGGGAQSVFLADFTSTGAFSWSRTWTGLQPNSLIQTSSGGFALTGEAYGFGPGGSSGYSMFLVTFTSTGSFSWSITWGGSTGNTYGNYLIQTSSGGYAITGYTTAFGPGGTTYDSMFLATFTSTGTLSWSTALGGTGSNTYGNSVIQTSSGGYTVAGYTDVFGPGGSLGSMFLASIGSTGQISGCTSYCQYDGTNYTSTTYTDGSQYTSTTYTDGNQYTSTTWVDGVNYTSSTYVDGTNYNSTTGVDGIKYASSNETIVAESPLIDVGTPLAALNTAASVSPGQAFRVRVDLNMTTAEPVNGTSFELQYALCGGSYANVTTSTPISYYQNANAIMGMSLATDTNDPTDSSNVLVRQEYEQSGTSTFTNPVAIPAGEDGMWDFALTTVGVSAGQSYCLQIVNGSGSVISAYNVTPQINIAASVSPPNTPTSLVQETTANSVISTGGWVNSTSVKFAGSVSSANSTDTIQFCVEVEPLGTNFTNTATCGTGVAYSGTAVTASVTITGLSSGTQYHWQAQAQNSGGTSAWTSYGGNPETSSDFGVDTVAPTIGTVYDGTTAGFETTFNSGSLSQLSANWSGFSDTGGSGIAQYMYSIGTTPGGTGVLGWTSNGLNTSVTATGLTLQTSQVYYVNVEAIDAAGNTSSVAYSAGQLVAPSITFSVSPATVSFGALSPSNSWTSTQSTTLTANTNAYNGFVIRAYMPAQLTAGSYTIPGFTGGSYASPDSWQTGDTGFGYTSSATSIQGSNIFQSNPCPGGSSLTAPGCYAPYSLTAPGDIVADVAGPVTGSNASGSFTISNRITSTTTQQASNYSGIIVYTITASY